MKEYWDEVRKIKNTDDIDRGLFMILPLRFDGSLAKIDFDDKNDDLHTLTFDSSDFTELMSSKCRKGDYVKRFCVNSRIDIVEKTFIETINLMVDMKNEKKIEQNRFVDDTKRKEKLLTKIDNMVYVLSDLQLFVFYNGIAFLSVYIAYKNKDVDEVYQLVNPGYIEYKSDITAIIQEALLHSLEMNVIGYLEKRLEMNFDWFVQDKKSRKYLIKEAYRVNVAAIPNRFVEVNIAKSIAYNGHRLVDVSREFSDKTEHDVIYSSGAKDVDDEKYGWAVAITSQEISFAYGPGPRKNDPPKAEKLVERTEEDLILTVFLMYQKYTCMLLNEEIHKRYTGVGKKNTFEKNISDLKREVLEFIAYGTLAASQVSRWNNVCEIYNAIQKTSGINELLEEINRKIKLLNEEQESIENKRESRLVIIVTVFGFISIIAASLQIIDYVSSGRSEMLIGLFASLMGITILGCVLFLKMVRSQKKKMCS